MTNPQALDAVTTICRVFGHDPNQVKEIQITPEVVEFELYMQPKQMGADGPLTVHSTHLWRL